ncbi:MAG: tetratricopeptide repeat protein [Acidimicrobiales bacterium]|nr:tetratricopeptide repeat protein [Acidimicrobiales bacterium]
MPASRIGAGGAADLGSRHRRTLPLSLVTRPEPPHPATGAARLFGRDAEVGELQELLWRREHQIVTIVGPPGIGKSRVAFEVAARMADDDGLADGVRIVDLTTIDDSAGVVPAIAAATGLDVLGTPDPAKTLGEGLRHTEMVLVLDNFEHVLEAVSDLTTVLAAAPRVTVLVTSRVVTGASGERRFTLEPLDTAEAVRLFDARALAANSRAALDGAQAAVVSEICVALDCLPLAIELAAARVHVLSVEQIRDRLERRMDLLSEGPTNAPGRQRSMRATIAWSYDTADGVSRELLRALAVVPGTFGPDAVEALGGAGALTVLARLVDQQFVRRADGRYRIPETVRQFAADERSDAEHAQVMQQLVSFAVRTATQASAEFEGRRQHVAADALALELDIIRLALRWSIDNDPGQALLLCNGMARYWNQRGAPREGVQFLGAALAAAPATDGIERARALDAAGLLLEIAGEADGAEFHLRAALAMFERCGEWQGRADATLHLGNVALNRGEVDAAETMFRAVLDEAEAHADERRTIGAIMSLGTVAYYRNDRPGAERHWERSLRFFRRMDDWLRVALLLSNLGVVATQRGDHARASRLLAQALDAQQQIGDRTGMAMTMVNLSDSLLATGELARARQILDDALVICVDLRLSRVAVGAWVNLGRLELRLGRSAAAADCLVRAVVVGVDADARSGLSDAMELGSSIAADRGEFVDAARLRGAMRALRLEIGADPDEEGDEGRATRRQIEGALGREQLGAAVRRGESEGLGAAVEIVHRMLVSPPETERQVAPMAALPMGLTPREAEILGYLARRYTDREIGAELYISVRTVTTHVARILTKLGVDGRRQAAAEAARLGLVAS